MKGSGSAWLYVINRRINRGRNLGLKMVMRKGGGNLATYDNFLSLVYVSFVGENYTRFAANGNQPAYLLRTSTNLRHGTVSLESFSETPPWSWTTDVIVFGNGCILTVAVQYYVDIDHQRQPINCLPNKASPGPDNRTKRIAPEITTFAKYIKPTSKPCCTVKQ